MIDGSFKMMGLGVVVVVVDSNDKYMKMVENVSNHEHSQINHNTDASSQTPTSKWYELW